MCEAKSLIKRRKPRTKKRFRGSQYLVDKERDMVLASHLVFGWKRHKSEREIKPGNILL